jgi:hypothetical protein
MRLVRSLVVSITVLMPLMLTTPVANASDSDVERRGSCSGSSRWELDLERDHGRIEVDFEVRQNTAGDRWRVVLKHDGDVFFRDVRITHADDDGGASFDVDRVVADHAGTDPSPGGGEPLDGRSLPRHRVDLIAVRHALTYADGKLRIGHEVRSGGAGTAAGLR